MPRAVAARFGSRAGTSWETRVWRQRAGVVPARLRVLVREPWGAGLAARREGGGWVEEDERAVFRPAEEAAQHVGLLVAVAGAVAEESFEVGGGGLGPAGHRPGGCEVDGQVSEDPEPGLQGDIAERVPSGAPGSFLFCELAVVGVGDRRGPPAWDG